MIKKKNIFKHMFCFVQIAPVCQRKCFNGFVEVSEGNRSDFRGSDCR